MHNLMGRAIRWPLASREATRVRGEAPAVRPAQPAGLGTVHGTYHPRPERPAARSSSVGTNGRPFRPSFPICNRPPRRCLGLDECLALRAEKRHPRAAFTLLEILLTLSMSVVLIALIGGAIQFYGRDLARSDEEIRRVQLAASLIQMIEDDLRCALHGEPVDTAPLKEMLSAASSSSGGESSGSDSSGRGESSSSSDSSSTSSDASLPPDTAADSGSADLLGATALSLTSGTAALESPGLIGNQTQIQFDVSRLPRLEEYMMMMDESTAELDDLPSDIKTVAYYVQAAGATTGVSDSLASDTGDTASTGGLVRRSLDRAATRQAALTGGMARLNQTGTVLAPEVTSLAFSYWDGTMWQPEWSSDAYGELPLAVKVELTFGGESASGSEAAGADSAAQASGRTFTHVIRLPLARPADTTGSTMMSGSGL